MTRTIRTVAALVSVLLATLTIDATAAASDHAMMTARALGAIESTRA